MLSKMDIGILVVATLCQLTQVWDMSTITSLLMQMSCSIFTLFWRAENSSKFQKAFLNSPVSDPVPGSFSRRRNWRRRRRASHR